MGLLYTAAIDNVTFSAAGDVIQLAAGSVRGCSIHSWELTSSAVSAEALRIYAAFATTAGSGGTGLSEVCTNATYSAVTADATAMVANSTAASTLSNLKGYQWEQLGPVGEVYTPEERPGMGVGDVFVVVLATAPGAPIKISGTIKWEEY